MSHRPRTRLLLLVAAVSVLAFMPPAHADGMRFTYTADQLWGGYVFAAPGAALGPVLGPVACGRAASRGLAALRTQLGTSLTVDGEAVPSG